MKEKFIIKIGEEIFPKKIVQNFDKYKKSRRIIFINILMTLLVFFFYFYFT